MRIYFVRHGESAYNAARVFQPGTVELSEKGVEQAKIVADRFKNIDVDKIITSDYKRARQTAEIISSTINKEVIATPLARERKNPSEIHGKSVEDEEALRIKRLSEDGFADKDFHYSDEENFHDLKARAIKLIEFINKHNENNVLVVIHGTILRCVTAVMMFSDGLTAEEFRHFNFFSMENTGITVCEKQADKWRLIAWNDHAHLG